MALFRRACVLCLLLALICPITSAQLSKTYASLEGQVTDATGAVVATAHVSLQNIATTAVRADTTSAAGTFVLLNLPVGEYRLRITAPGFAIYERPLTLAVGQFARLRIQLSPASTQQTITVNEESPALDVSQPTLATTVDKDRIEELPVRSRNYLNFVLLAPGVTASPRPSSPSTAQTVAAENSFSFAGLRPTSNGVSIDGVSNNDEFSGMARSELSLETVREFQVVNNGLSAEAGGASGGAINVVTRAGSNIHHGDAFLFAENGALDAAPKFQDAPGKPDLQRYRVGVSLGGALVRNRTFYYAGFEQEHNRGQASDDIAPADIASINQLLAGGAFPVVTPRALTARYVPTARAETEATARFDHQLSPRQSLMLRYAFTNNRVAGDAFNDGGLFDASARGSSFVADHALSGSLASVLSETAVNDLRFQAATRRVVLRTDDATGPEIDIAGLATFGQPWSGNSRRRENQLELTDSLSLLRGAHLWKLGGTVRHVSEDLFAPDGFGGQFTFASLADFAAGAPQFYAQALGDARVSFATAALGVFLQQHWTVSPRLTFDAGLRYDFQRLPKGFNADSNNFSPRLGFAFTPADRWVLRGGYGIYFDRYLLAAVARPLEYDGVCASIFASDAPAAGMFFRSTPLPLVLPPPSIFSVQPHLPTSYSQQASFGVEHQLARNWTATADFLHVRGVKLSRTVNVNLAPPVNAPGGPLFLGRLNPNYGDLWQLADTAGSTYNGLSLVLNRRMSDEIEFTGAYTLSKTTDDASSFAEQPQNPYDMAAERAPSLYDQRQRFVFSGLFDLPLGEDADEPRPAGQQPRQGMLTKIFGNIELAPIFTAGSARPVDPLTGIDSTLAHTLPLAARPAGWKRNSLRLPGSAALDFRVLKYFLIGEHGKLDVVAEFFNLANRTNVAAINPVHGDGMQPLPGFDQPIEAQEARRSQFSLDFEF